MENTSRKFTLYNWDNEKDKDKDEYYADAQFRWDYMSAKMLPKANACTIMIEEPMRQLITSRANLAYNYFWQYQNCFVTTPMGVGLGYQPDAGGSFINPAGITLRILSLGCGPGTDLLAAIRACASVGGVARIECFGVDKNPWPLDVFKRQLELTQASSITRIEVRLWLWLADSSVFIDDCIRGWWRFDLVISCYAGARDKLHLFGSRVPQLLTESGRIFIIDNYFRQLRDGLHAMGFASMPVRENINRILMFLVYSGNSYTARPSIDIGTL